MFDGIIDGHEVQSDFYDEMQAEADSGLPQLCVCGELFQDCDCPVVIVKAPADLSLPSLTYWQQRAETLLCQPVIICRQWITEDGSPYAD